jgi:pimeloyl-ACP methyl ester carboxylesterase
MTPIEEIQVRIHDGNPGSPVLVYLPGVHGDWTLVASFRAAVSGRVRFVEFTYPRQPYWSLSDYAQAIEETLANNGIAKVWLLGESFGSQVAWELARRNQAHDGAPGGLEIQGIILAGGFVRHPFITSVRAANWVWISTPLWFLSQFLKIYAAAAPYRHRHAPETLADLSEFVARRNVPDKIALGRRLDLIAENDPRPTAREFREPVYYLSGGLDPIVPWPWVRRWLRSECPGFREATILRRADHNVLGTEPKDSARSILAWIGKETVRGISGNPPSSPGL